MNNETYEQVNLAKAMIDRPELLKESSTVDILFDSDNEIALTLEMAQHIVLEITYTEPGIRGDTATNVTKPATGETGAEIKVPLFINEGDKIKIDSRTGSYLERVKS